MSTACQRSPTRSPRSMRPSRRSTLTPRMISSNSRTRSNRRSRIFTPRCRASSRLSTWRTIYSPIRSRRKSRRCRRRSRRCATSCSIISMTTAATAESVLSSTVFFQEIIGGLVLLFAGLIAFFIARSVSNPILALTKGMRELAEGNFGVVLPGLKRKDESRQYRQGGGGLQGQGRGEGAGARPRPRPSRTGRPKPSARPPWRRWPTSSRPRSAASSRPRSPATSPSASSSTARPASCSISAPRSTRCATMSPRRSSDLIEMLERARRRQSQPAHHRRLSGRLRRTQGQRQYGRRAYRRDHRPDQGVGARSLQRLGGDFDAAPPTCRSAPRSRPRAWKRPRPRWKRSPRP